MMTPELDALVQKDRIRDLIYSYCQAVDRLDYDRFPALYWPDAKDEHGFNPEPSVSCFIESLKPLMEGASAIQHCVTNIYIKLDGDYAEAEVYLLNTQFMTGPDGPYRMLAGGRYNDKIERRNGVWKFLHRRLVMDWATSIPGAVNELDHGNVVNLSRGRSGPDDPSYAFFTLFRRGEL
ncbi:SnoaL-like domain-containing protein [Sphingobium faniae]|nr:SnoaL-like domain-containing protein [Sphingobium faniae]